MQETLGDTPKDNCWVDIIDATANSLGTSGARLGLAHPGSSRTPMTRLRTSYLSLQKRVAALMVPFDSAQDRRAHHERLGFRSP